MGGTDDACGAGGGESDGGAGGASLRPEWSRGRLFDRRIALMLLQRVRAAADDGDGASVLGVGEEREDRRPPSPLNTVALMRLLSPALEIGRARGRAEVEPRLSLGGGLRRRLA